MDEELQRVRTAVEEAIKTVLFEVLTVSTVDTINGAVVRLLRYHLRPGATAPLYYVVDSKLDLVAHVDRVDLRGEIDVCHPGYCRDEDCHDMYKVEGSVSPSVSITVERLP